MDTNPASQPICVDLDGTFIRTDSLVESVLALLRRRPASIFAMLTWLSRGRAHFKAKVAQVAEAPVSNWPVHGRLRDYLEGERAQGRQLVLATAADQDVAEAVAAHHRLFDQVLSSDGVYNLSGRNKARRLVEEFGVGGFVYAGNSRTDIWVWEQSAGAIVVGGSALADTVAKKVPIVKLFSREGLTLGKLLREIRLYQWVKNLLIFVPLIGAHELMDASLLSQASLAFLAFSLSASAGYVFNDLLDLEADRQHPSKKNRPLASGAMSIGVAILMLPILMGGGLALGAALSWRFLALLAAYVGLTLVYSSVLKKLAMLDVFVLGGLYTLRVFAGEMATGVPVSEWLLAFSMFVFLSLAMVKRYSELRLEQAAGTGLIEHRGYQRLDSTVLVALGTASACLSVLVLALYVQSDAVAALYAQPRILWLACPLVLYWLSRVWLLANRGLVDHDPILFAFRDPTSYVVGGAVAGLMLLASS